MNFRDCENSAQLSSQLTGDGGVTTAAITGAPLCDVELTSLHGHSVNKPRDADRHHAVLQEQDRTFSSQVSLAQ